MTAFRTLLRDFAGARRGNVAILFGLALVPILIGAGVAIDTARAAQKRTVLQEAADGALLRVARLRAQSSSMTDAELTTFARRIVDAATSNLSATAINSFSVSFDAATEVFSLNLGGAMNTSLMQVAGVETMDINTISQVKLGKPPFLEVVMALDNTGSMNDNGKLASLKSSANALVDSLFSHPGAQTKVGLVPFAQYVNVGVANKTENWMGATTAAWQGCVGSRAFPANTEDGNYAANPIPAVAGVPCPMPILPMTADKAAIVSAINAMTASGNTYIPSGLAWGWRALTDQAPFDQGVSKTELANKDGKKILILLTDGENTKAPTYPAHDSSNRALADDMTSRLCDAAKGDEVVVYTIAFAVTDALIKQLLKDCATTPGHSFEPSTASELAGDFEEIANSLRNLSLSK